MGLIQAYVIVAVATALVTLFFVFLPLLRQAREKGISNVLVDSPFIAGITYFCVTAILAPFVISVIFYRPHAEMFLIGLQRAIEQPDD